MGTYLTPVLYLKIKSRKKETEVTHCDLRELGFELRPTFGANQQVLTELAKCALCGEEAKGRRNEHLLFECTAASVVELRYLPVLRPTALSPKSLV